MENTHLYWLTAHSNLHVGSGDTNYGVIDNLVQRDILTELPTINESSLKGALKEYCTHQLKRIYSEINTVKIHKKDEIRLNFGNSDDTGNLRFYGASLFTFPVRSDKKMFFNATSPQLLRDFRDRLTLLGFDDWGLDSFITDIQSELLETSPLVFLNDRNSVSASIEFKIIKTVFAKTKIPKNVGHILPDDLVILHDMDAKKIFGKNRLPVIARNSLTDGQSDNLWYEEIVPRQSKFYFFVQDNAIINSQYEWFENTVSDKAIQIGGNASIGQGLCKITKSKFKDNEK